MKIKKKKKPEPKDNDSELFESLVGSTKNIYSALIEQIDGEDVGFLDTGSYMLNAQMSGSIYGGYRKGKIYGLAGEEATGKSYMLLKMIKLFLESDPRARVLLYETEWSYDLKDMQKFGCDISRIKMQRARTVEEIRFQANKFMEGYLASDKKKRFPLLIAIDSFGQVVTDAQLKTVSTNENKADYGKRAQLIKSFFNMMTIPCGVSGVTLLFTNHIYIDPNGSTKYFIKKVMGGGKGPYYSASGINFFSKSKDKEGSDDAKKQVGVIVKSYAYKSRRTVSDTIVELKLSFKNGLSRYYGLLKFAADCGIVTKDGSQYLFPGQEKLYFEKHIYKNPEQFFTKDILSLIDEECKKKFMYSNDIEEDLDEDDEEEIETTKSTKSNKKSMKDKFSEMDDMPE